MAAQSQIDGHSALDRSDREQAESDSPLSPDEVKALEDCESVLAGFKAAVGQWVQAGDALARIHRERLYRETHGDFVTYLRDKWGMSKAAGYRLMQESDLLRAVSPIGDTAEPAPAVRSHLRALSVFQNGHGTDAAAAVYKVLTEPQQDAGDVAPERLTARQIRHVTDRLAALPTGTPAQSFEVEARRILAEPTPEPAVERRGRVSPEQSRALDALSLAGVTVSDARKGLSRSAVAAALAAEPELGQRLLDTLQNELTQLLQVIAGVTTDRQPQS